MTDVSGHDRPGPDLHPARLGEDGERDFHRPALDLECLLGVADVDRGHELIGRGVGVPESQTRLDREQPPQLRHGEAEFEQVLDGHGQRGLPDLEARFLRLFQDENLQLRWSRLTRIA